MRTREFVGEALGTFLLVLFGCGSVAVSVLFNAHKGLMNVALAWGIGVTLAIYLTRHLSCAHLNPAVSLSMALSGRMTFRKLPVYLIAQFFGAILAGLMIYALFAPSIGAYETAHQIVRGSAESVQTAKMFGEYYPDPGGTAVVSLPLAIGAEGLGTFLLVLMVFALTEGCNVGRPDDALAPVFIGLTVTSIICLIAPITQAGLNPARDLGPRMVAWLMGWGDAAFPDHVGGFFHVYVLAPLLGGVLASQFFIRILEPAMKKQSNACECCASSANTEGKYSMKAKLIVVGGFLGAGKTTLLWESARQLIRQGHSVGLVANDQASDLVDTAFLSRSCAGVREVSGSCFCCNFGGFMDAVQSLIEQGADIVIAEPVGSCTDLSATIFQPIKDKHPEIDLAPLTVLVDPELVQEILRKSNSQMHKNVQYILRLQMLEADRILLSKIDTLGASERIAMLDLLRETFPEASVDGISAITAEGLKSWLAAVLDDKRAGMHIADVDYDRYAEGESVLGWLNAVLKLESATGDIEWAKYGLSLMNHLHEAFQKHNAPIGHVKLIIESGDKECTANLTRLGGEIAMHGNDSLAGMQARCILNARVQISPTELEEIVRAAISVSQENDISTIIQSLRCLMPGRPNPTYRYARRV